MAGSTGDWSAEFHSGKLHRVENLFNRIVADCTTMKGAALDLTTGEIDRRDWVAKAACGIQSMATPRRLEWLGTAETVFGVADRVEITDDVSTRVYDVLPSGVLVSSTYRPKSGEFEATTKAVAVTLALPAKDIFSEASLQSSFVPDQYKQGPAALHPPNDGQAPPERGF